MIVSASEMKGKDVSRSAFILVPREPTPRMLSAYCAALENPVDERARPWHMLKAKKRWSAMLEAYENETAESRRSDAPMVPGEEERAPPQETARR